MLTLSSRFDEPALAFMPTCQRVFARKKDSSESHRYRMTETARERVGFVHYTRGNLQLFRMTQSKLLDRSPSVCILVCGNMPVVSVVSWWGNEKQYDNECCQESRTLERYKAWLYPHGLLLDKYQSYLLDGTCPFIGSSCKFRDIPEVARIRSRLVPWLAKSWKARPMGWVPPPILGEHADSMPSTIELVLETRYPYPWEGDSSGNDG